MQAPGDGDGGAGMPSGPGGHEGRGGWEGDGEESAAAGAAPQVQGASPALAPGAEGPSSDGAPASTPLEFALTVPFLSYTDAEVARRCLSAGADLYHGAVQRELTVIGSDLIIRLTSEDPGLLQISTASLLSRLSIVVQTMQHFVPPVFVKHRPGKGG